MNLASWLWEQNNEHRMPVARLLLLGALKASGGDYRAGGLLNMALLLVVGCLPGGDGAEPPGSSPRRSPSVARPVG